MCEIRKFMTYLFLNNVRDIIEFLKFTKKFTKSEN